MADPRSSKGTQTLARRQGNGENDRAQARGGRSTKTKRVTIMKRTERKRANGVGK